VLIGVIERHLGRDLLFIFVRKIGILDEILERRLANNVPLLKWFSAFGKIGVVDVLKSLRMGKAVSAVDLRDFGARYPGSVAGSDLVSIKAHAVSNAPALRPSVAQEHCDGVVGMSGLRPDRALNLAAVAIDFDN